MLHQLDDMFQVCFAEYTFSAANSRPVVMWCCNGDFGEARVLGGFNTRGSGADEAGSVFLLFFLFLFLFGLFTLGVDFGVGDGLVGLGTEELARGCRRGDLGELGSLLLRSFGMCRGGRFTE